MLIATLADIIIDLRSPQRTGDQNPKKTADHCATKTLRAPG